MTAFVFDTPPVQPDPQRAALRQINRAADDAVLPPLIAAAQLPPERRQRIKTRATALIKAVRAQRIHSSGIDAFMHEYALSSQEGVALMCLAEALLRVPDAATIDALIRSKIGHADWARHAGRSGSTVRQRLHLGADAHGARRDPGGKGRRGLAAACCAS